MFVGQELRFGWVLVAKLVKDYFNVKFYWEAAGAVSVCGVIVLFQVNTWKFISFPTFWYFIVFLEDFVEVAGMFSPHISYSKIINYKAKFYWVTRVFL